MSAIREDLGPYRQGDTWFGLIAGPLSFDDVAQSLTGGRVLMTVRKGPKRGDVRLQSWDSDEGEVTIAGDGSTATIPEEVLEMTPGVWWYDIQVTLASGTVVTPWYGTFEVSDDIGV